MKNVWKVFGLILKLACLVAMLAGCIFLIKMGFELLPKNGDIFTKLGLYSFAGSDAKEADLNVTYEEIYNSYKSNELQADDLYSGNRYRITATVKDINSDGLFNLTGGATLNLRVEVGDAIAVLLAEFEKDQEEALKKVTVGDTVVFEGTCISEGAWTDCKIVEEE